MMTGRLKMFVIFMEAAGEQMERKQVSKGLTGGE